MIKRTVQIGSEEFKNAVLDVIKQAKSIVNDIENPRFERLADGWIKDKDLNLEWGPSSSESMNFKRAEEYCTSLGGRLPTVDELFSLVDRNVFNPATDKKVFKDVRSEWYWTSDKYVGTSSARWVVIFIFGNVVWYYEDSNCCARPVRPCQC